MEIFPNNPYLLLRKSLAFSFEFFSDINLQNKSSILTFTNEHKQEILTIKEITMTLAIILLFIIQLILPVVLIISLWKGSFQSKLDWILKLLTTGMFTIWVFYSGRWDWISYYFRYFWLAAFIIAALQSWKKAKTLPFIIKLIRKQKVNMAIYAVLLIVFTIYNTHVFSSHVTNEKAIELSFP
jgi:hypothetical protein